LSSCAGWSNAGVDAREAGAIACGERATPHWRGGSAAGQCNWFDWMLVLGAVASLAVAIRLLCVVPLPHRASAGDAAVSGLRWETQQHCGFCATDLRRNL
jgi:hypothetical protein